VDALHKSGWSVGVTAFASVSGGLICVVCGYNGENAIRGEGSTSTAAWRAALDQAREVGMAPGWRASKPDLG
jgi:hypothetical protein